MQMNRDIWFICDVFRKTWVLSWKVKKAWPEKGQPKKRKHFNHCWKYKGVKCSILCIHQLFDSLNMTKLQCLKLYPSLWKCKVITKSVFPSKKSLSDWEGIYRNRLINNDTLSGRWCNEEDTGTQGEEFRKLMRRGGFSLKAGCFILSANPRRSLGKSN